MKIIRTIPLRYYGYVGREALWYRAWYRDKYRPIEPRPVKIVGVAPTKTKYQLEAISQGSLGSIATVFLNETELKFVHEQDTDLPSKGL